MSNLEILANQATEKITQRYHLKGIDLLSICSVVLPGRETKNQLAAFDSVGVTIYEYTPEEELVEFGTSEWEEFPSIVIKHFDLKTDVMLVTEDRFRKLTVIDGNGKEIENFIREHTPATVDIAELKWYNKLPGFRTETRWKMITAAIVYLWILGTLFKVITGL